MTPETILVGAMVLGRFCHWSLADCMGLPTHDFISALERVEAAGAEQN
ncbi:hypothetical protein [Formicincola oecophyllae]|nr:hypothetical protein [Formicincola oecophyllae]